MSRTTAGVSVAGTYDDQDRLMSYGAVTYAYQDSGELWSRMDTASGETTVYTYDAIGNLREIALPNGTIIEYLVDGHGRRVGKKVDGVLVQEWLYADDLRPVAALDPSGLITARFSYGERRNVPEIVIKGGVTYRIVTDHLGSPRLVVDVASGNVAQRMDYDDFGRVVLDTSPGFQPFGFAGGLYDADTGLVRFGARDYDAVIGRWTTKDPSLFGGGDANLYGYGMNDPVNMRDEDGDAPRVFCKGTQIGMDCMMRCADAGISCTAMRRHPYKSNGGSGKLFACNSLVVGSMCSYAYDNGDSCHFPTLPFPVFCSYTGGEKSCEP